MIKQSISIKKTAQLLDLSEMTVRRLISAGYFTCYKSSLAGHIRLTKESVEQYQNDRIREFLLSNQ